MAAKALLKAGVVAVTRPRVLLREGNSLLMIVFTACMAAGYVIVDFNALDEWFEEDERNHAHLRSPLLLEAPLPVRYYLPPEDVSCGRPRTAARGPRARVSCSPAPPGRAAPTRGKPPTGP